MYISKSLRYFCRIVTWHFGNVSEVGTFISSCSTLHLVRGYITPTCLQSWSCSTDSLTRRTYLCLSRSTEEKKKQKQACLLQWGGTTVSPELWWRWSDKGKGRQECTNTADGPLGGLPHWWVGGGVHPRVCHVSLVTSYVPSHRRLPPHFAPNRRKLLRTGQGLCWCALSQTVRGT